MDAVALQDWLIEARRLLRETDREEIGELQIGKVFAHASADPDGTFPTLAVRGVIERAPNDHLARGFAVGLYNKRGVTVRGMTEGGQQEYQLARQYDVSLRDWIVNGIVDTAVAERAFSFRHRVLDQQRGPGALLGQDELVLGIEADAHQPRAQQRQQPGSLRESFGGFH